MMIKTVIVIVPILMILSCQIQAKHNNKFPFTDNAYTPAPEVYHTISGRMESSMKQIKYPLQSKMNKISGKVLALVYLNEYSDAGKGTIIKGVGNGYDKAITDAIVRCKFNPGMNKSTALKTKLAIKIMVNV